MTVLAQAQSSVCGYLHASAGSCSSTDERTSRGSLANLDRPVSMHALDIRKSTDQCRHTQSMAE
jgi:hypothetical protein